MITVHHNPAPPQPKRRRRRKVKNEDYMLAHEQAFGKSKGVMLQDAQEAAKVGRAKGNSRPRNKPRTRAKVQSDVLRAEAEKFIDAIDNGQPVNTLEESELRLLGNHFGVPRANSASVKTLIAKVAEAAGAPLPPSAELVPLSDFKRKRVKRQYQKTRKQVESKCTVTERVPVKVEGKGRKRKTVVVSDLVPEGVETSYTVTSGDGGNELSGDEAAVYLYLKANGEAHIDTIAAATGIGIGDASAALFQLELDDKVLQLPQKFFKLKTRNPMARKRKKTTNAVGVKRRRTRKRRNPAPSFSPMRRTARRSKRRNPEGGGGGITLNTKDIMNVAVEGAMAAGGGIAANFLTNMVGGFIPAIGSGYGKGLAEVAVGIGLGVGVQMLTKNKSYGKAVALGGVSVGVLEVLKASNINLAGLSGIGEAETVEEYFNRVNGIGDYDPQFGRYVDDGMGRYIDDGMGRYIDDGMGYPAVDDDMLNEYQETYYDEDED